MDMWGREEGEGERYGESNKVNIHHTCKIDSQQEVVSQQEFASQWEFAVWLRELKRGLCNNLEGWDGEGDGKEAWKWGDMGAPIADSCWCLTENNKILKSNYSSIKKKEYMM